MKLKGFLSATFPFFLSALFSTSLYASGKDGEVAEPDVLSPQTEASDVSAFYLGVSAGYGAGGTDRFGLAVPGDRINIGDLEPSGGYGGIRGGWRGIVPTTGGRDYVYGVELTYDFGTLDDTASSLVGGTTVDAQSAISDVFSIRFRNGITNRSRSVLYFFSVGYARGEVTTSSTLTGEDLLLNLEDTGNRNGFSASLGAEHRLNKNWSITGEIEYFQFESEEVDLGSGFSTKSTPNFGGLRVGLNYTF
ncbi:outer membrane protein [Ruegeria arenilitoris]|uniref:outer membrane protein n=1 Tax=Ruegeria arenilitoris TaxID=1173585 RepID=UPI00147BD8F4|nr:outer membrane beta-barrel protein [Ruegeria arenilitoris]